MLKIYKGLRPFGDTKMNKKSIELSDLKKSQLNKQPIVETSIQMSEDKKWVVHKTIITDIKPVSYMDKVMRKSEA